MSDTVLLGDRFSPITSAIGFVEASLAEAADGLRDWRQEIYGASSASELAGGLEANVLRLQPLTTGIRPRELVVATSNPGWTAIFDCGLHGGDQVSTVRGLGSRISCRSLAIDSVPHTAASDDDRSGQFGSTQFELRWPDPDGARFRSVSSTYDGGRWRFETYGQLQGFEDETAYTARRVRDRFTPALLAEYCLALGVDAFSAAFYPGPAVLIENPAQLPQGCRSMSLTDARRAIGIS